MSIFLLAALAAAAQAAAPVPVPVQPRPLREGRCDTIAAAPPHGRTERAGLHVLEQAAAPGLFAPGLPAGDAIACSRTSIVPGPDDGEVLEAGHVLYIVEALSEDDQRVGALELSQGQFRYRLTHGQLSAAEGEAVGARLNHFQTAMAARRRAPRGQ